MRSPDGIETILNNGAGQFGFVAVPAQMPEVNMLKIGGNKFGKHGSGGFVAEVPMATHDPLFDAPGAADIVLKQFHVVVRFEDQDIGSANTFHDELGCVTEISKETDATSIRAKHEANGIVGVMRDGKSFDGDFAELKGSAGVEETKIETGIFELEFDRFFGETIAVNRDGQFVAKRAKAVGVVGMFVREENAAQAFGRAANLGEPFTNLFGAETGIDQEASVARLEVGAIAV